LNLPRSLLSLSLSLSLVTTLAACNAPSHPGHDTAAAPASPAPAATAPAAAPATPAEASPATPFTLTMGKVDGYLAAVRNLGELARKNPELEDVTAMNASEENEAQYAARLRANPQVAAALAKAGLTPEDFSRTGQALAGGMMTAGALESGALKKIPDGIDPQYVAFAQQNKAALAQRMKALQQPE
jgi:hypothetical protein